MIKNCNICGREFQAQRTTAKYCSHACRQRAYVGSGPYQGENIPVENTPKAMSEGEVATVIQGAHSAVEDMSRASLATPAPLCLKLRRAAHKMEGALRGEGL